MDAPASDGVACDILDVRLLILRGTAVFIINEERDEFKNDYDSE